MKSILLLIVGLSVATGSTVADMPVAVKPPCCRENVVAGNHSSRSLYQLDSKWTSDVGRVVKLEVLRGRPQVVAMFFAQCEYSCPIVVQQMKSLEQSLSPSIRDRIGFLLVSFDVERDTPEALSVYRRKMNLGPERWTILRGDADDVRELAALFGINYQKDGKGQFAHSNVIAVLNAEGEIIHRQTGLKGDTAGTLKAIENADKLAKVSR